MHCINKFGNITKSFQIWMINAHWYLFIDTTIYMYLTWFFCSFLEVLFLRHLPFWVCEKTSNGSQCVCSFRYKSVKWIKHTIKLWKIQNIFTGPTCWAPHPWITKITNNSLCMAIKIIYRVINYVTRKSNFDMNYKSTEVMQL